MSRVCRAQYPQAFGRHPCSARPFGFTSCNGRQGQVCFSVLISGLIVFVVSAVVTFTNIGLRADFVVRWLKAFVTGWPVAALLAFFAGPYIRRATEAIVRRIDGAA
jgi:Protein of unknown function (DUF2798)